MISMENTTQGQSALIMKAVCWCLQVFQLPDDLQITVDTQHSLGYFGACECKGDGYEITLAADMGTEDLVGTVIHEMTHVWQWVIGAWEGDGEAEAAKVAEVLTPVYLAKCLDTKI